MTQESKSEDPPLKALFAKNTLGSGVRWDTSPTLSDSDLRDEDEPLEEGDLSELQRLDEEPEHALYLDRAKSPQTRSLEISVPISFTAACTFSATVFGKAVV